MEFLILFIENSGARRKRIVKATQEESGEAELPRSSKQIFSRGK